MSDIMKDQHMTNDIHDGQLCKCAHT